MTHSSDLGPALHLRSSRTGPELVSISLEEAGWSYISFTVREVRAGETVRDESGEDEVGLVILSGHLSIESSGGSWTDIGERENVFDHSPYVVYLPPATTFSMIGATDCLVARASAPASGGGAAYLVTPKEVAVEVRGQGNATRYIRHLLEADRRAQHLFLVECITPSGNWSSYPPHKHDTDDYPTETYLEEIYYHRIRPTQGFGFQRIYTGEETEPEALVVEDGSLVCVRRGYHPVVVAPGYELYYLNVMAGPIREWRFTEDPDHAWVSAEWRGRERSEVDRRLSNER